MSKRKRSDVDLGLLVRKAGEPATPMVDASVGEVRTCINARWLPEVSSVMEATAMGAIIVIWDYSLPHTDAEEFHQFLRDNESFIAASASKVICADAYRGTYMEFGYGNPRYRTVWAYASADVIDKWATALKNNSSPFYAAMLKLRAFWMRDPDRSEARWVPASFYLDPNSSGISDSIGKLTVAAAKLNAGGTIALSPKAVTTKRAKKK